jgi:hypothetical protein
MCCKTEFINLRVAISPVDDLLKGWSFAPIVERRLRGVSPFWNLVYRSHAGLKHKKKKQMASTAHGRVAKMIPAI